MITKEKINTYIDRIPPAPKALRDTLMFLRAGELVKASKIASEDLALHTYLKELVNKPIFGLRNQVNEISQIFGILGVSQSEQVVYNYMVSLLSPAKWQLFKLNKNSFHALQAELSVKWALILEHLKITDKSTQNAISLLPASIIVSEALFSEKIEDVRLLRSVNPIDLNTILKRLTGLDLFDLCEVIANKWEMEAKTAQIIQASSGLKPSEDLAINNLGKWMHLLLFYVLSQPQFVSSELNDFIDFKIEYIDDIYGEFAQLMEIA